MLYVFIKNEKAVSLYKRLGFKVTETIHNSRYIMKNENKKYKKATNACATLKNQKIA